MRFIVSSSMLACLLVAPAFGQEVSFDLPIPQPVPAAQPANPAPADAQVQVELRGKGDDPQHPAQKDLLLQGTRRRTPVIKPDKMVPINIPRVFANRRFQKKMPAASPLELPAPMEGLSKSDLEETMAILPEIFRPKAEWTEQQKMLVESIERKERMLEGFLVRAEWRMIKGKDVPEFTEGFVLQVAFEPTKNQKKALPVVMIGDYLPREIDVPFVQTVAETGHLVRVRGWFRYLEGPFPKGWVLMAREVGIRETTLSTEVPLAMLAEPLEGVQSSQPKAPDRPKRAALLPPAAPVKGAIN